MHDATAPAATTHSHHDQAPTLTLTLTGGPA
jgi:hypothetical protein